MMMMTTLEFQDKDKEGRRYSLPYYLRLQERDLRKIIYFYHIQRRSNHNFLKVLGYSFLHPEKKAFTIFLYFTISILWQEIKHPPELQKYFISIHPKITSPSFNFHLAI